MATIFDNIETYLDKELQKYLTTTSHCDFCVGFFRLSGWDIIAPFIEHYDGMEDNSCRLLIGMNNNLGDYGLSNNFPMDNQRAKEMKIKAIASFIDQLQKERTSNYKEAALRKLIEQIKLQKVQIKLHLCFTLHAKLYILYGKNRQIKTPDTAYLGSSNLTYAGLKQQGELNTDIEESDAVNKLKNWFINRWEDNFSLDISKEITEIIEQSWAGTVPKLPYHIFLKMVYHLSKDARQGMNEFRLPKKFKTQLLDFQVSAVQLTAKLIQKRNGAILGDVVGLGKTITASAIAKIFEEDFGYRTLIICPKNLKKMWEAYKQEYELHADVISISKVDEELKHLRTYKLVIIDESHNLRNRESQKYGHIFRYLQEKQSFIAFGYALQQIIFGFSQSVAFVYSRRPRFGHNA